MRKQWLGIALAGIALATAACGGTPGKDTSSSSSAAATTAAPATSAADTGASSAADTGASSAADTGATSAAAGGVQTDGFDSLGPITLKVWSADNQTPGPLDVITNLSKQFEAKYPNVKVELTFKGFTDYINTVKLGLSGNDAPDIAEGNQGYQIDGDLVKAGLILPLDKYAAAYGWDKMYSPETLQQFQWTDDGKTYGQGTLWGVGQFGQSTGIFANAKKLKDLGIDPASPPTTWADFEKVVLAIRAKLPKDEPVVNLGNKDGYELIHAWGMLQGANIPDAQAVRDWIFHKDGATFDTPENVASLKELKAWVDAGVFGKDFNSVGENDAAAQFAKGKGVFYMGGNWQAGVIRDGLGADALFINAPPGVSGKHIAIGSTSLPWHISAKTKYPDVAAAWINFIISAQGAQEMYKYVQIPAVGDAPQPTGDPLLGQVATGWQQLNQDGGLTFFTDWSSPTMFDTMGAAFQKLAAGKATPEEVAKTMQDDWEKFHAQLKK